MSARGVLSHVRSSAVKCPPGVSCCLATCPPAPSRCHMCAWSVTLHVRLSVVMCLSGVCCHTSAVPLSHFRPSAAARLSKCIVTCPLFRCRMSARTAVTYPPFLCHMSARNVLSHVRSSAVTCPPGVCGCDMSVLPVSHTCPGCSHTSALPLSHVSPECAVTCPIFRCHISARSVLSHVRSSAVTHPPRSVLFSVRHPAVTWLPRVCCHMFSLSLSLPARGVL